LGNIILKFNNPEQIKAYKKVGATNMQVYKLLNLDQYNSIQERFKNNGYINKSSNEAEANERRQKAIQGSISYIISTFAPEYMKLYKAKMQERIKRKS
jgi:hypothetical protein